MLVLTHHSFVVMLPDNNCIVLVQPKITTSLRVERVRYFVRPFILSYAQKDMELSEYLIYVRVSPSPCTFLTEDN